MKIEAISKTFAETLSKHLGEHFSMKDLERPRSQFAVWDSLKHLDIMLDLESSFAIRFNSQELISLKEPQDIILAIRDKIDT